MQNSHHGPVFQNCNSVKLYITDLTDFLLKHINDDDELGSISNFQSAVKYIRCLLTTSRCCQSISKQETTKPGEVTTKFHTFYFCSILNNFPIIAHSPPHSLREKAKKLCENYYKIQKLFAECDRNTDDTEKGNLKTLI